MVHAVMAFAAVTAKRRQFRATASSSATTLRSVFRHGTFRLYCLTTMRSQPAPCGRNGAQHISEGVSKPRRSERPVQ
jgi:hypothetical protein